MAKVAANLREILWWCIHAWVNCKHSQTHTYARTDTHALTHIHSRSHAQTFAHILILSLNRRKHGIVLGKIDRLLAHKWRQYQCTSMRFLRSDTRSPLVALLAVTFPSSINGNHLSQASLKNVALISALVSSKSILKSVPWPWSVRVCVVSLILMFQIFGFGIM